MESGHYTNRHCESRCNRDVAIPYLNDEIASALSRLARTGVETCRATSGGSQFQWKEAAGGFEPPHRGFADPRLNLLATPPSRSGLLERKTGFEPATPSLARKYSTTELLPLLNRFYRLSPHRANQVWCRGGDLNSHGLAPTTPSRWRVCLFHHLGLDYSSLAG